MSNARFSILQAKAVKDKRVSDAQFRTLAALGMYADQDGWCYPLLQTLGDDLGKSKQAVGRDTIALRKLGYLEVTARFTKEGARRSSLYRLVFDTPRQRDVDTPSTSYVDTPSTSEVDVNDPKKRPNRKGDLLDGMLEYHRDNTPLIEFEKAFGFGNLPWYSNSTWDKFAKWVVRQSEAGWFNDYVTWRENGGKYKAFSNKKIRENPLAFIDTGYPEYETSKMYRNREEVGHEL